MSDFDFSFQPSVDRKLIEDLASCRFVADGRPIVFLGQPGTGKTMLATALCTSAVEAGYRGYFTSAADLVSNVAAAYADGTFATRIRVYTGPSALVIDDVGLVGFDRAQANALFQVVNRRYEHGSSTIVTTNRSLSSWGELFGGDGVIAAAILDRLLHRGSSSTSRARPSASASTRRSPRRSATRDAPARDRRGGDSRRHRDRLVERGATGSSSSPTLDASSAAATLSRASRRPNSRSADGGDPPTQLDQSDRTRPSSIHT